MIPNLKTPLWWGLPPQLADISEIRGFWSVIPHYNQCAPHPFFFFSNRRHSSSIHLLFTPSSFHHAMDDMPSDGAVAVGPHHSDGMGNELKMSRSGRRQSGRNEEKRRNKGGGGEKCRQGRCERRTRWSLHTFSWSFFTPQPCCLHWLPLFCPLFHILHAFKMLNGHGWMQFISNYKENAENVERENNVWLFLLVFCLTERENCSIESFGT